MKSREWNSKVGQLEKKVFELKNLALDSFEKSRTGHLPSSYSCAEILVALYYGGILRYKPKDPKWEGRDLFMLSKGHAALMLYCVLADIGFIGREELYRIGQAGALLGVHAHDNVPGIEATSGSLGCGLGIMAGMALADKMDRKNVLHVALLGDAECNEGAVWESAMFASQNRLNNLVAIIDHNHMGCSGFVEENVGIEPLDEKFRTFGFDVRAVNGHSMAGLLQVFQGIRVHRDNRPICIIADTVKANGLKEIENTFLCHGWAPKTEKDIVKARRELAGRDI